MFQLTMWQMIYLVSLVLLVTMVPVKTQIIDASFNLVKPGHITGKLGPELKAESIEDCLIRYQQL